MKPVSGRCNRKVFRSILFLLVLIILLGGIIWHYSRFPAHGKFVFLTEASNIISVDDGEIEYKRLLVRNRYPFVLTITARLCRVDGDPAFPRLTVLDTRYYSYTGGRSWYSGAFESHVTFVTSEDGRFTVTDRSGTPLELLNMPTPNSDTTERNLWIEKASLLKQLASDLRNGELPSLHETHEDSKENYGEPKFYSLPGGRTDRVLVITLMPKANTGR